MASESGVERLIPGLPFSRRMDAFAPGAETSPGFDKAGLSVAAAMVINTLLFDMVEMTQEVFRERILFCTFLSFIFFSLVVNGMK